MRRYGENKGYNSGKRISTLEVGEKIDVLSKAHIWCSATITRIRRIDRKLKAVFVHFDHPVDCENSEEICENSNRLAKGGFYTSRNDVPKYDFREFKPGERPTVTYRGKNISEMYYNQIIRVSHTKLDANDSSYVSEEES
eukprot:TRINITY_DN8723_c0_g1_i1.p1 TRINITY_DN8723_c0_g1~~TRINITY_DN8723_c0_g1_i1.p1  ORF type:complete len:140 (-),score=17.25 TRINITY_DN8723_c0_g1_i1:140-559(-)